MPKEPVRSWTKITNATATIPTGSRETTEAAASERTWGVEKMRR
jgi:hypothetical protein